MMHRGRVLADALWFPPTTRDLPGRLLRCWEPQARLVEGPWGHVLLFATPRPIECQRAPGAPLVGGSCDARPARGKLRLRWHGELHEVDHPSPADPTPWLASLPEIVEGEPLARPRLRPTETPQAPPLVLREQLPGVPPPAPALQQVTLGREAPTPSWWRRLLDRLTPSNQQSYLRRLTGMLEQGDWDQALRHGIPLGGNAPSQLAPYLGSLRPRQDLTIGARRQPTRAVPLQGEDYLRMLYRRAYDQLDRAGQVDQAAFVLAELLGEHQQAVLYLEKHRRFRVAARLAEARNLDPSLRIRLWFQAGELDLAVQLASRYGAYQQAYLGLNGVDRLRAEAWRWEWARHLAGLGRPWEALELVWGTGLEARREWLQPALDQGGMASGLALARWLQEPGHEGERLLALSRTWLEDDDPLSQGRIQGLALGLLDGAASPEARLVAAEVARAAWSQSDQGGWRPQGRQMEELVRSSQDPWLRADMPPLNRAVEARREPWNEQLEHSGSLILLDAVTLSDGRLLAALGEAGLAVISARGRLAGVLPVPTHRLIAPRQGNQVLLLAGHGGLWNVTRLDPASLKTRPWCTVRNLEWTAPEHDGERWLVVQSQTLYAIDLGGETWRNQGKVPLGSPLQEGTLGSSGLGLRYRDLAEFYSLPDLQLRRRVSLSNQPGLSVSASDVVWPSLGSGQLGLQGATLQETVDPAQLVLVHHSSWTSALFPTPAGLRLWTVHNRRVLPPANFLLPGTSQASVRWQADQLVLADDRGRLYVGDLERGWWVRSLGLSPGY